MNKTIKQHAPNRPTQKKGLVISGKFKGEGDGFITAPVNPRTKELLSKAHQAPVNRYIVVQINPDLARQAEQKKPVAKAEAAREMFAKYHASK